MATMTGNPPANLTEPPDVDSVLIALQELVNHVTGENAPIERDARIDRYFADVSVDDELEYLDLGSRIEAQFGICISNDDWEFLSGGRLCASNEEWQVKYAPFFTFGRLAELIAQRLALGKVEPITVLGSTSRAAGAFRAIERIAKEIDPKSQSFAPSTPILDRFRGRNLDKLWGRLRAMSKNRIPPLPLKWPDRVIDAAFEKLGVVLIASLLVGAVYFGWVYSDSIASAGWLPWILGVAVYTLLLAGAIVIVNVAFVATVRVIGTLFGRATFPKAVTTFRDLAELIAGDRAGWCTKCGYDLTGVQQPRCPECGTDRRSTPIPKRV